MEKSQSEQAPGAGGRCAAMASATSRARVKPLVELTVPEGTGPERERVLTKTGGAIHQSNFLGFSVKDGGGTPGCVCYQPREMDGAVWGRDLGGGGGGGVSWAEQQGV